MIQLFRCLFLGRHHWVFWDHLSDKCTCCGRLDQKRGLTP